MENKKEVESQKLTIKEIITINNCLNSIAETTPNTSLWYCILRNKKILKPIIEEYRELQKEIVDKTVEKNEKGEIKREGNEIVFKNKEEYEKLILELQSETREVDFYTFVLTPKLIEEQLSPILMEPLIDKIIIE